VTASGPRRQLWHVDLVRVIAFSAVIVVHSIAFTESPSNRVAAGGLMVLQFGREIFFALTGFVLVYSLGERDLRPASFWRRRLAYVAAPFLTWTAIYYVAALVTGGSFSATALLGDLVTGDASYHLYFLLVTAPLYLIFPALVLLVRRTATHPWMVLAVVGALNVAWLGALQYTSAPPGLAWLWRRAYELLPTYSVWVLAGCYGAVHREPLERAVRRYGRRLLVAGAACVAASEVVYVAQLSSFAPRDAAAVLQPGTAVMCAGVIMILLVATVGWADRIPNGHPVLRTASDISFGVYLAHPLVLGLLLHAGLGDPGRVSPGVATLIGIVIPAAAATGVTLAARRTRLSTPFTGRPRRARGQSLTQLSGPCDAVLSNREDSRRHETNLDRPLTPVLSG
jgi:peptidoglycan/LPS O-acetylase OafA/YrhL